MASIAAVFFIAHGYIFDALAKTAHPRIPNTGKSSEDFVPAGWTILKEAQGDLNGDGKSDAALVLASEDEENAGADQEIPKRVLIILMNQPGGLLKLSAMSDSIILCKECGGVFGDSFSDVTIERGTVVVKHYGGSAERWGFTHRFRYQNNGWYLIGETAYAQHALGRASASVDKNLITGLTEEKKTTCSGKESIQKIKSSSKPLVTLKAFDIETVQTPSLPSCN